MKKTLALFTGLALSACSGGTPGGGNGGSSGSTTAASSTSGVGSTGAASSSSGTASAGSSSGGAGSSSGGGASSSGLSGGSTGGGASTGGVASSSAGGSSGAASTGAAGSSSGGGSTSSGGSSGGGSTGAACTSCPNGFACGTANGIPVCRNTQTQIPLFSHVFLIMEENTSSSQLSASGTPYLTSLAAQWATSNNYSGAVDPSLPNYIALTSGGPQNITCDCNPSGTPACQNPGCSNIFGTSGCNCGGLTVTHLGDQLDQAGLSWKMYGESMGTACNPSGNSPYAPKHVPFLYYQDVLGNSNASYCPDHVLDFIGNFAADLAGTLPSFSFITPNLNDDMHGTGFLGQTSADVTNGDTWLGQQVPPILASQAFQSGGIVLIAWDEGGGLSTPNGLPFFLLSPLAKKNGYVSSTAYTHYSLLATIEDGLGLARLGGAQGATPLQDFFPAN
ncbi:MAG: alkaline phosphatase family protein [Myxococcales bacterium]